MSPHKMASPLMVIAVFVGCLALPGCSNDQASENQRQIQQLQQQLDQQRQQIEALQAQRSSATVPPPAGGCDTGVMRDATRKGGAQFAANSYGKALGYYQDAVTACPTDAQAQLNLARTYEALGESSQAISHYRLAAQSTAAGSADAVSQARDALRRLGAGT